MMTTSILNSMWRGQKNFSWLHVSCLLKEAENRGDLREAGKSPILCLEVLFFAGSANQAPLPPLQPSGPLTPGIFPHRASHTHTKNVFFPYSDPAYTIHCIATGNYSHCEAKDPGMKMKVLIKLAIVSTKHSDHIGSNSASLIVRN